MASSGMTSGELLQFISKWNEFSELNTATRRYLFYLENPIFGKVPMLVTLPKKYNRKASYALAVILHGAVQLSNFERAEAIIQSGSDVDSKDADILTSYFVRQNYIILSPIADPARRFSWVRNEFSDSSSSPAVNKTFGTITDAIVHLKQAVNIDDSRVYAIGHSDGADGCFGLANFVPSTFAGFVLYNSMLTNLACNNIYLNNIVNRPIYIVHSELDALRPIEQIRLIIKTMQQVCPTIEFKEYPAMRHYDKHIELDLPRANLFMLRKVRNPFQTQIYFESNNERYSGCDWLKVTGYDLALARATWQTNINAPVVSANGDNLKNASYYTNGEGYAIRARYADNVFYIDSSRVLCFEILISPLMVDMSKQIRCIVNGIERFKRKVKANKQFMADAFEKTFDRKAIWVNVIRINNAIPGTI